eukprot:CAMPEP_0174276278 /NCGR_PEP_ID=MMETSP0439-20130205/60296_1 /TAXON_ID=0 /ORGANISM="Stereomyxa ramosa, Strain Chinc5" /LENGTH=239 /DNA_ID=CAMNT_0015368481 /DNA_START=31 /DNA_END=750 /DNA_ORIENTATION=-
MQKNIRNKRVTPQNKTSHTNKSEYEYKKQAGNSKYVYNPQEDQEKILHEQTKRATPYVGLVKVISGGQTGADRAGLEAAAAVGLKTGGTAPANFQTENGPDRSLKTFGVVDDGSLSYKNRTKKNVDDSDGTLAIRIHVSAGTDKTIGYCQQKQWTNGNRGKDQDEGWRPVVVFDSIEESKDQENITKLKHFVFRNQVRVLNVAGHRETTAGVPHFQQSVTRLLTLAFSDILASDPCDFQ